MPDEQTAKTEVDDLAKIYIRAHINGRWGSYSLRELMAMSEPRAILEWFKTRIFDIVDLQEAEQVQDWHVKNMISVLESLTQKPLVRVRPFATGGTEVS